MGAYPQQLALRQWPMFSLITAVIIVTACDGSGCHDSGIAEPFDLSAPDGGYDTGFTSADADISARPSVSVAAALRIGCAITGADGVWCWGVEAPEPRADESETATGFRWGPRWVDKAIHAPVKLFSASQIVCGLDAEGGISCWGLNERLGPDTIDYADPAFTRRRFDDLTLDVSAACGRRIAGRSMPRTGTAFRVRSRGERGYPSRPRRPWKALHLFGKSQFPSGTPVESRPPMTACGVGGKTTGQMRSVDNSETAR